MFIDDKKLNGNLIIASYIENSNKYNYNPFNDIRCLAFLKLKSNNIFLVGDSDIYLMQYNEKEKELKEIKACQNKIDINNKNENYNFLCYELLNEDIIFSIDTNKFCYFNMKTFMIQTVFEYKQDDSHIDRFCQLRDINSLYFGINNLCFEVNLKNGKIKYTNFNSDKSKYNILNNYYISYQNKDIKVKNNNDITLFSKTLYQKSKTLIINEKEGLFAALFFIENCYAISIHIFKIDKNND